MSTILKDLSSSDWRIRKNAIEHIVTSADAGAIAELVRALREEHEDIGVINSALQVLMMMGVDVVASLVTLLEDSDPMTRVYAAQALGESRNMDAVLPLIAALNNSDSNVRYHAIEALGKLRDTGAVAPLLAVVEQGDPTLAFPAIEALAAIGDPAAVPALLPYLPDEFLGVAVIEALGALGDSSCARLIGDWLETPTGDAVTGVAALIQLETRYEKEMAQGDKIRKLTARVLGPQARAKLLAAVPTGSDARLKQIATVLGWLVRAEEVGTQSQPIKNALLGLMKKDETRSIAIAALTALGRAAVPGFVQQLSAPDPETRREAAAALGSIGDASAVPALTEVLETSDDSELLRVAATALGRIGNVAAFDGLVTLFGHPSPYVRQAAIAAVNSLGGPEHSAALVVLLQNSSPLVRESAIRSLGYFGSPETAGAILTALDDKSEMVRLAVIETLPFLDVPQALPALTNAVTNGTLSMRAAAARALAHVNPEIALPLLRAALRDPDAWTRLAACRSLGRHRDDVALPAIAALLKDAMPPVRAAACESLGEIDTTEAIAALRGAVNDPEQDVVIAALNALAITRHDDAVSEIADKVNDPARKISSAALDGLLRHASTRALEEFRRAAARDELRPQTLEVLAGCRIPETIPALLNLLSDPALRDAAVTALIRFGQTGIPPMRQMLVERAGEPSHRRAVVDVLKRVRSPRAMDVLAIALQDPDTGVHKAAALALREREA